MDDNVKEKLQEISRRLDVHDEFRKSLKLELGPITDFVNTQMVAEQERHEMYKLLHLRLADAGIRGLVIGCLGLMAMGVYHWVLKTAGGV